MRTRNVESVILFGLSCIVHMGCPQQEGGEQVCKGNVLVQGCPERCRCGSTNNEGMPCTDETDDQPDSCEILCCKED
ncbi:MAG: hypothetical protein B7733_17405 [Myxococcales bacterium FL481]|nr:MAG: hypothetical protein B7733_17405 [Myxococcales bacterium FL481]